MESLKKYKTIPVHIVEYHHEALPYIYKAIGGKYLPLNGIEMLHFDAHPDLVIPDLKYTQIYNKNSLFNELSIENWIIPALYAGHINELVWFKPPWACQITDQTTEFYVGHCQKDEKLKVNLKEGYFISEGAFLSAEKLQNKKCIKFNVKTINCTGSQQRTVASQDELSSFPWILDIDLDFFSTNNPIKDVLDEESYAKLKAIYNFESLKCCDEAEAEKLSDDRKRKLQDLKRIWECVESNQPMNDLKEQEILQTFKEIFNKAKKDDLDVDLLHGFGCTCDEPELPCYKSNEEEINNLFNNVKCELKKRKEDPVLITISRSTEDEYCPQDQVEGIQTKVISILSTLYPNNLNINFHYKDAVE